jgi:hypothetical protein
MERAHASMLDGADVHERIARAIGRGDEAEALLRVKELHGTCCHLAISSKVNWADCPRQGRTPHLDDRNTGFFRDGLQDPFRAAARLS